MRKYLPFIIFVVLEVVTAFLPIPSTIKYVLLLVILAAFSFYRRNVFCYLHANSLLRSGKKEKAWKWYDWALKSGITAEGYLSIGSLYIQYGDIDKGNAILKQFNEKPPKGKTEEMQFLADMLLALVVYKKGDHEKGIAMMEEVHKKGFRSTTLAIDLITMYLDNGKKAPADAIWKEYRDEKGKDVGLDDCFGRLLLLDGKWEDASELYLGMITKETRIVNEFVHTAQTMIHYGNVKDAITMLTVASKCAFNNINTFSKENVDTLLSHLKAPETREAMAHTIDEHVDLVAAGGVPAIKENHYAPTEAEKLPGFAKAPVAVSKKEKSERVPDTSLDASDEDYLKNHPEESK